MRSIARRSGCGSSQARTSDRKNRQRQREAAKDATALLDLPPELPWLEAENLMLGWGKGHCKSLMHWQDDTFRDRPMAYSIFAGLLRDRARDVVGAKFSSLTDFAWDNAPQTVADVWNDAALDMIEVVAHDWHIPVMVAA